MTFKKCPLSSFSFSEPPSMLIVQPTQWKESKHERIRLPRKAAFFTAVAAEAASLSRSDETIEASKELWLLASKLYSLKPNPVDGGGSYGWATLRACCFDSLSTQGNCELSLEAVEQLLALLCKLDPDIPLSDNSNRMILLSKADERSNETTVGAADPEGNKYGPKDSNTKVSSGLEDVDVQDAIASASQFAKSIRASYASFTATSPFLTQQSKWAGEDPIPPACVPLSNFSPLSSLLVALKCVWPQMDYGLAFEAQMRCLNRLAKLRRAVPTSSTLDASAFAHGLKEKCLPVYVSAAMSVLELPRLELEIIQKRIKPDMSKQGAMATFFNPYDKKKQSDEPTARVAEGDERVMVVKFGNNLSVSIEITRGQLSFDDGNCERVKTSSVSFVLPPKACDFAAHFPFTVWPQSTFPAGRYEETSVLGVKGIDLTCFGRCFFLPVQTSKIENTKRLGNFPISASEYMYRTDVLSSPFLKPRIESYPSQPRLKICIDKSGCPADVVSISLADGEMYTAPSFRLSNSGGTNSLGKIECLEILSSSVSGRRMYCSNDADPPPEASESDFFRDLIHGSNPPPFKLRAKLAKLSVDGINDAREEATDHNTVTFQIATAHNFGLKLPNETSIEVVFRYRGPCTAKAEVWRKQTVVFRVLPKSGPRISSIEFRPDFIDDGAFADDIKNQWSMTYKLNSHGNACKQNTDKDYVTNVGLHPCLSVSGRDAVVMITIVNETSSCLTVTKTDQFAVSHAGSSMKAVMVDPLVSVKLKVAIPSLPRCDENGDVIDAASTLIDQLVFVWESQSESDLCQGKTRGYIRILPGCLRDIVANHPNILSQICQPPCSIQLTSCDKDASDATSVLALGSPLALDMYVAFESWVPKDVAEKCRIHLEFYCKRKVTFIGNELDRLPPSSLMTGMKLPEFVWAGKMSHSEDVVEHDRKIKHSARVAFLRPGTFAISACARISRRVNGATVGTQMTPSDIATQVEEIWWAPVAQTVNVSDTSLPAQ